MPIRRSSAPLLLTTLALLLAAASIACSPDRIDAPPVASGGDRRLASAEVEQAFAAWVCPRDPAFAVQTFEPKAVLSPSIPDGWTLRTIRGDFSMRETDRQFAPSAEVAPAAEQLRASARCR